MNIVTCAPTAECHAMGTCDPATGSCSDPIAGDGSPCTGGTCPAGVCEIAPMDAGTDAAVDAGDDGTSDVVDVTDAADVEAPNDAASDAGNAGDASVPVDAARTDAAVGDANDGGDADHLGGGANCGCRAVGTCGRGGVAFVALALSVVIARRRRRDRSSRAI